MGRQRYVENKTWDINEPKGSYGRFLLYILNPYSYKKETIVKQNFISIYIYIYIYVHFLKLYYTLQTFPTDSKNSLKITIKESLGKLEGKIAACKQDSLLYINSEKSVMNLSLKIRTSFQFLTNIGNKNEGTYHHTRTNQEWRENRNLPGEKQTKIKKTVYFYLIKTVGLCKIVKKFNCL